MLTSALLLSALYGPLAQVPERPSNGLALIISGAGVSGVGLLNLATTPVCLLDAYARIGWGGERGCIIRSLVIGGVVLAVGVPLLTAGLIKRSRYKKWLQENKVGVHNGPRGGLGFFYRRSF